MTLAPEKLSFRRVQDQAKAFGDGSWPDSEKPVRVCFVIDRLDRAGTESQLLLLLKQFDRARIAPYLCLLDGLDEISRQLEPSNVPVVRLGVRRLVSAHSLGQAHRFFRFLRQERIDAVMTFFTDSTRFAAPIAKFAGVQKIFSSRRNIGHWMTAKDRWIARIYNRLFIDKIIANCRAAQLAVINQEWANPDRVVILRNCIDHERFAQIHPWQPKPNGWPHKIGMVGNLRQVKGIDLFIRAAKDVLMEHPDTLFEIAGGGDSRPYRNLIDELGLSNNVRLLGRHNDVPEFLATLDVAVLPSRAEGLSNALLEYMAAGRPIVATKVGGNSELIEPAVSGLLVKADEVELAIAINQLLSNYSLAGALASAAAEASLRHTFDHSVLQLQDLFVTSSSCAS